MRDAPTEVLLAITSYLSMFFNPRVGGGNMESWIE
jgi:hypothetical protein